MRCIQFCMPNIDMHTFNCMLRICKTHTTQQVSYEDGLDSRFTNTSIRIRCSCRRRMLIIPFVTKFHNHAHTEAGDPKESTYIIGLCIKLANTPKPLKEKGRIGRAFLPHWRPFCRAAMGQSFRRSGLSPGCPAAPREVGKTFTSKGDGLSF